MCGSSRGSPGPEGCSQTVLVFDSGTPDIGGAASSLRNCNADVVVASDAEGILRVARETSPNLVLLDEDDWETLLPLQSDECLSEISIILLANMNENGRIVRKLDTHVVDFVAKPVRHEDLVTRVALQLRVAEQTERLQKQAKALEKANLHLTEEIVRREQVERGLRLFSSAVEQSSAGIAVADLDGHLLSVNNAFARIHGYEPEEILGKHLSIFHTPEQMPSVEAANQQIQETGHFSGEISHVHRDGTAFPTLMSNSVLRDEAGEPIGIVGTLRDITERKKAEEALRLSEARYRLLFDNTNVLVSMYDKNGVCLLMNRAVADVFGGRPEDFIGKSFVDLHPEAADEYVARVRDVIRTGEPRDYEDEVVFAPEKRWLLSNVQPVRDADGNVVAAQILSQDITDRKRTEEERRKHIHFLESLERIERAIRGATDLDSMINEVVGTARSIFDSDRVWLLYPCNPAALSFRVPVESTRPEYPGACVLNLDVPIASGHAQDMRDALTSKDPVTYTNGTERPVSEETAGQFRVLSQIFLAVYPRIGEPWLFGMHQCSHARVWTEEDRGLFKEIGRRIGDGLSSLLFLRDLQESESRYRTLFDSAPLGILVLTIDGVLVDANPQACKTLGYSRERFLDLKLEELLDEPFFGKFEDAAEVLRRGEAVFVCGRQFRSDGTPIEVEVYGAPFMHKGELQFLAVLNDVTERMQIDREREELIAKLEAQNAELERFTYTVSHDLKSPLITVQGFLGALREDIADGDGEAVELDVQRISRAAHRMGGLLDDLLEMSRIGRLTNPSQDVALEDLVSEAREALAGKIRQTGARIVVSSELPVLFGDASRLAEVMQNLIENALKYTGNQSAPVIEIGARREGDGTICYVRDNGIGINPRYHEKIFQLFDQLDPTAEGGGIGLALVKRIVETHGGRVWVESSGDGHGSTFCFTLPSRPGLTD
jgi:two-component system, LuxR family, sensor kinase FixL